MTKTIFGKKLLLMATITVLVTGLMLSATFNDAEAKKDKEPKEPKTRELKCKDSIGAFVSLGFLGPTGNWGPFVSTAESKCKSLGHAAFTTVTEISGGPGLITGAPNCIEIVGAASATPDGYGISKKGFFTFNVGPLEQCLFAANGVDPPSTAGQCGASTDTWFSTVTGPFVITGGLIKGAPVAAGGGGTLSSTVDHCAGDTAPGTLAVITTLTGNITY